MREREATREGTFSLKGGGGGGAEASEGGSLTNITTFMQGYVFIWARRSAPNVGLKFSQRNSYIKSKTSANHRIVDRHAAHFGSWTPDI